MSRWTPESYPSATFCRGALAPFPVTGAEGVQEMFSKPPEG